jgi:hypothetical protein
MSTRQFTKEELAKIEKSFAEQNLKIWTGGNWLIGTDQIHCEILVGTPENLPIAREAIVRITDFDSLKIINIDVRFQSGHDICEHVK